MADCVELKKIAKARLKSAETLMKAEDWQGAAYLLGYTLECALKAVVCKTLHLVTYPEHHKNEKVNSFFMTHRFELLLIVSGLEEMFSSRGPKEAWQNWSEFTLKFPGEWTEMRYQDNPKWDKVTVEDLYKNLIEDDSGILTIINKKKKW